MPEVRRWPGQEVALPWCPLEGDGGAVPSWATTPTPVARATLVREPDEGGSGTATVTAGPHLKGVERFE
ncbi:MAG TPA: hypothetical protein VF794_33025 [Archangium sp.]|jgi:hypothetical protein